MLSSINMPSVYQGLQKRRARSACVGAAPIRSSQSLQHANAKLICWCEMANESPKSCVPTNSFARAESAYHHEDALVPAVVQLIDEAEPVDHKPRTVPDATPVSTHGKREGVLCDVDHHPRTRQWERGAKM